MTMRPGAFVTLTAALLAAVAIGACSDDEGLLPASSASRMDAALQRVADATNSGDCAGAAQALADVQKAYDGLPSSVDARLRTTLLEGLEQLTQTVPEQCAPQDATGVTGPQGTTGPPQTTTTEPPTTTTTEPPATTAPPPETTTTPPTETTPDPGGIAPGDGGQGPDGQGPPGQDGRTPPGQGDDG
jgi:hypothetical protein